MLAAVFVTNHDCDQPRFPLDNTNVKNILFNLRPGRVKFLLYDSRLHPDNQQPIAENFSVEVSKSITALCSVENDRGLNQEQII